MIKKKLKSYSTAFETEPYYDDQYYTGFNIAGYELGLIGDPNCNNRNSESVFTYWGVDDVQKEFDRLISLGATTQEAPHNVGGDIIVGAVRDPWGNIVGLIYNPEFKLL